MGDDACVVRIGAVMMLLPGLGMDVDLDIADHLAPLGAYPEDRIEKVGARFEIPPSRRADFHRFTAIIHQRRRPQLVIRPEALQMPLRQVAVVPVRRSRFPHRAPMGRQGVGIRPGSDRCGGCHFRTRG